MAAPDIKFSEFVDLVLYKLYEIDRERPDEFVSLGALAESIKYRVPPSWVFDAGRVLETRSLADVIFTFGGTDAKISGEGRLYVEEGRGLTNQIQQSPAAYYNIVGNGNQVVHGSNTGAVSQTVTIEQERSPAFHLIEDIVRKLAEDTSLPGDKRSEATTYANLIRQELKKPEPNRNLIGAVIEPLSKIGSIAGSVASLIKLFNASL
jgi:hypothetical protein